MVHRLLFLLLVTLVHRLLFLLLRVEGAFCNSHALNLAPSLPCRTAAKFNLGSIADT